jgi:hypothetical protein
MQNYQPLPEFAQAAWHYISLLSSKDKWDDTSFRAEACVANTDMWKKNNVQKVQKN